MLSFALPPQIAMTLRPTMMYDTFKFCNTFIDRLVPYLSQCIILRGNNFQKKLLPLGLLKRAFPS